MVPSGAFWKVYGQLERILCGLRVELLNASEPDAPASVVQRGLPDTGNNVAKDPAARLATSRGVAESSSVIASKEIAYKEEVSFIVDYVSGDGYTNPFPKTYHLICVFTCVPFSSSEFQTILTGAPRVLLSAGEVKATNVHESEQQNFSGSWSGYCFSTKGLGQAWCSARTIAKVAVSRSSGTYFCNIPRLKSLSSFGDNVNGLNMQWALN